MYERRRISEIFSRKDALTLTDRQMKERGLRPFTEPRFLPNRRIEYDNKSLLCARELGIAFEGKRVLNKVSFSTDRGHVLAIVGGNGAGKSTLCRVITGLYKQNIGQVIIDGLAQKKKNRLRKTFFVQQDADYQLYAATVEDEFRIGKRHRNISVTEMEKSLSSVGLENMLHRHPLSLSGGQKQRLLLAISAVSGKEIIVLDEPTSGLDGANMQLTAELLRQLADNGGSVLLITHDLELVKLAADSMLYMNKGEVVYHRQL